MLFSFPKRKSSKSLRSHLCKGTLLTDSVLYGSDITDYQYTESAEVVVEKRKRDVSLRRRNGRSQMFGFPEGRDGWQARNNAPYKVDLLEEVRAKPWKARTLQYQNPTQSEPKVSEP